MQPKFTQRNFGSYFIKIFALTVIFISITQLSFSQLRHPLKIQNNSSKKILSNDVGKPDPTRFIASPSPNAVCSVYDGSLDASDLALAGARMGRDAVPSDCTAPKTCPGPLSGGAAGNVYDTYSFTNPSTSSQCVTISLTNTGSNTPFAVAYLGSFSPSNICTNYLADGGGSPTPGNTGTFSFTLPASATVVIVVNTTTPGNFTTYTLSIDGICPACTVLTPVQPANATVSCGNKATFTLGGSGSGITYQWQQRVSATAPWTTVTNTAPFSGTTAIFSGATAGTLNISNAPVSMDGFQYRVLYSGTCTPANFSNVATLNVAPFTPTFSPAKASICAGSIQKLAISSANPGGVVTVNSSTALNLTIPDDGSTTGVNNTINVSGIPSGVTITSIKVKMNVTHSWVGDLIVALQAPNGKILNLAYALTATGGASATTGFTNTVISSTGSKSLKNGANPYTDIFKADAFDPSTGDPTVPTGPDGFIPNVTTFNGLYTAATPTSVNGAWTLAMYDYYADNTTTNKFNDWSIEITYSGGGTANGVWTSPTPNSLYTDAAATIPYDGVTPVNTVYAKPAATTIYTATLTNSGTCTGTGKDTVTVSNPITDASIAVANAVTCAGKNASFTAASTTGVGVLHQWKVSADNGVTFTNVTNGGVYSGATTGTLNITGATIAMNNLMYKDSLYVTVCSSFKTSNVATLNVNPTPVVTLTASPYAKLYPGLTTTISATVAPNAGNTYTWFRNGIVVSGATGSSILVDVDHLGSYTVNVNDVKGCNSTSAAKIISDSSNTTLFIYPSPTTGVFQVRYYNNFALDPTKAAPGIVNVFDSKGGRVWSKAYTVVNGYTRMDVDLTNYSKGIYRVELLDTKGNRVKTGTVVVF